MERAALGIRIKDAGPNDAAYAGLPEISGVLISSFDDPSPAKQAGLQPGDIIIAVDGKPVNYAAQLQQAIGFSRPGQVVQIEVARKGGVRKTYPVKLIALQSADVAQEAPETPNDGDSSAQGTPMVGLGISVQPLKPSDAAELGLPRGVGGLVVTDVTPDGPAWEVLRPANAGGAPDIILAVEGKPVATEADLRTALKNPGPGGIVSLEVFTPTRPAASGRSSGSRCPETERRIDEREGAGASARPFLFVDWERASISTLSLRRRGPHLSLPGRGPTARGKPVAGRQRLCRARPGG